LFDRLLEGNLFRNFKSAYEILETYIKKSIVIDEVIRKEKSFPRLALREGLMNALVHRDYSLISGNLSIEIFSDKVEIINSGELLSQIKVADLKKEHSSYLRNPDIAKVCFIRGLIEMLGTGTIRMVTDCKEHGFQEPDWISENSTTKLIFPGISHQISSEGVNEGVNEGVFQGIEGVKEGVKDELVFIINILSKKPLQRANEIAKQLDKGISTVERYLKILKEKELIEFEGAPKNGGYRLKSRDRIIRIEKQDKTEKRK
jgi:ATP-dependent DNA helicase RecG